MYIHDEQNHPRIKSPRIHECILVVSHCVLDGYKPNNCHSPEGHTTFGGAHGRDGVSTAKRAESAALRTSGKAKSLDSSLRFPDRALVRHSRDVQTE